MQHDISNNKSTKKSWYSPPQKTPDDLPFLADSLLYQLPGFYNLNQTSPLSLMLKLFLETFQSQQGCLIVIWFTHQKTNPLGVLNHVRDDENWMIKIVKRAKVEKTKSWMTSILLWPLSELRLWPPITSQLQAFSICPGQVFEAERKGKGRSRIDPGSEHQVLLANPYHCTAGYFHLLPYLLQGIALLFPGWFLQSKCQWIFYPV